MVDVDTSLRDISARAKNGTGKTGAYCIPLLELITASKNDKEALIRRTMSTSYDDETETFEPPVYNSKFAPSKGGRSNSDPDDSVPTDNVALKSNISLFGGVMIVIGCMIGSGIFTSLERVHENAGSVGLSSIILILCGVFSAIGAYCYAELGTFITKSGGDYAYVLAAFGPFVGFVRMWIECIIIRPCTITVVAMTFALYVLQPFFGCETPQHAPQLLAASCIILLTLINAMSVKTTTTVQNIFTLGELAALVVIILTGFVLLGCGGKYLESFNNVWDNTSTSPGEIALAFYAGLWAFNGWNSLNFITEELENPVRNLPIAIGLSCLICTVVYFLTNIALYAGISIDDFVNSPAIAVTCANRYYGVVSWTMRVFVTCSCFGMVNGKLLTSSRLFFVAARENHMPSLLRMINPVLETPMPSVLFTGLLSLFYLLLSVNIYSLIIYVQIVNWVAIGTATVGLIYLRYKMPPEVFPRPLQVNLIWPVIFLLGCLFLVILPVIQKPKDTFIGIGIMLTSIPVYFLFIFWQNKPPAFHRTVELFTITMQKLLFVMSGEKKEA